MTVNVRRYCDIEMVQLGNRLRHLDPEKVAALAESMDAIGLQQPISVWSDSIDTLELVAGLHRLEAARKLGWEDIDCIFVDLDDLDRQLWEIDENLCRADLTDLERGQHTAKRAEIVKQWAELNAKSAINSNEPKKRGAKSKGQAKFIADIAKATGRSKRSVATDKARGENIAKDVQKEIAGTTIEDSGVQLDALAKATPEDQREAVKAVNLGHAKDVREVLPGAEEHRVCARPAREPSVPKRGPDVIAKASKTLYTAEEKERKKRRTSEEIHVDKFDHAIRVITHTCDLARQIDVPNLDSKRRSLALAKLRNAVKHIQELVKAIDGGGRS